MNHSRQVAILHELMSHIEAGTTARTAEIRWNRGEVYASRERLKLEKERLFDTYPLVAGLSGDVPEPGSSSPRMRRTRHSFSREATTARRGRF